MTTAFQINAFQNNAFQIYTAPTSNKIGGDDAWYTEEELRKTPKPQNPKTPDLKIWQQENNIHNGEMHLSFTRFWLIEIGAQRSIGRRMAYDHVRMAVDQVVLDVLISFC